jgi:hypothetical protein
VQVLQEEKLMPVEGYENTTLSTRARQRLRDLHVMLIQCGIPKGIVMPKISSIGARRVGGLTLSAVVEIAVATTERELKKKGKR